MIDKYPSTRTDDDDVGQIAERVKVAYVMSRFPKFTETFVLFEALAVERLGATVEIYPLLRAAADRAPDGASVGRKVWELCRRRSAPPRMHPEAEPLVRRANYTPLISLAILWANLCMMLRHPWRTLAALSTIIRANLGSANFLLGGLAFFPKAVYFARRMQAEGVTHVHAHFANHPAVVAWVIHRLTNLPYSFTAHGSDLHRDRHMLDEKVRDAAFVVTVSDYNKEVILAECGREFSSRVRVVHCGVDTNKFRPDSAVSRERAAITPRILSIGTLHEVKGHTFLIEACRRLIEAGTPVECDIVGDGPDRAKLARQIEQAQLTGRVRLLGIRSRDEIVELLGATDVFAVPSVPSQSGRREGIPVVTMEAMAAGTPVVASDLSGLPEIVRDEETGLLVSPGNPAALARAIERFVRQPPLRRRLAAAGRDLVVRQFDQTRNATRLIRLFAGEWSDPPPVDEPVDEPASDCEAEVDTVACAATTVSVAERSGTT